MNVAPEKLFILPAVCLLCPACNCKLLFKYLATIRNTAFKLVYSFEFNN